MKKIIGRSELLFILTVTAVSFPLGGLFDTSTIFLNSAAWYIGAVTVLFIVAVGAAFDMVGVAAAAARETPFHAMASKRVFGAKRAIQIVRNAERVSSICSDVVGDIAGVLSGAGALAVAVQMDYAFHIVGWTDEFVLIALTALITSLTVGAKAYGKTVAIHAPTPIILFAGRVIEGLTLALKIGRRSRL